jgi:RNA polymerase sigma-70 factor (ECF subfamily)
MEESSDQEVISAVMDGDVNAYAILVARYQQPMFNLMYRMTRSCEDAADLAQETFIKAYEQLYRFRTGEKFFPWLYTIGLNHSRNFLRRDKTKQSIPIEEWEPTSGLDYPGQQEEKMCSRIDIRRLGEALDQLPVDYREALVLRYHEEVPVEEIAAALELSESGVRMRVSRGLKKLREILAGEDNGKEKKTTGPSNR